ncbi:MAG TPA: ROK family protein [Candidatus Dormibacteraeota bacterium]|nr:ROK family protein [Candidatus Dormibacteraeota bacterium]
MNIGVDIGASKILVVGGDDDYKILASQKFPTPHHAHQGMVEMTHVIEQVAGNKKVKSIAVAAPGPQDRKKGMILKTPNMGWEPVNVTSHLKNHFKVPVVLEKDCNVAALAEAKLGAAKGYDYVLYVTISTGVGTGIIMDGQIYHGAYDPEGGHMLIHAENQAEELERAVSGPAIKRRFGVYGYEITQAKIWDELAHDMAQGIYNLITTISPSIVVMGGGVNVHFKKFEKPLIKHLKSCKPLYPLPPIVPAKFIETAPAYGALILASKLKQK